MATQTQYEIAVDNYTQARDELRRIKMYAARIIEAAQDQFDNAQTVLVSMEIAPGIPDPRFHSAFQMPKLDPTKWNGSSVSRHVCISQPCPVCGQDDSQTPYDADDYEENR